MTNIPSFTALLVLLHFSFTRTLATEEMTLIEYDCTSSTAIQRIAWNKLKNELIVIFEGRNVVYLYYDVPVDIEVDLISRGFKGGLVNKIKKIARFRKISSFPNDVKMHSYPTSTNGISGQKPKEKKDRTRNRKNKGPTATKDTMNNNKAKSTKQSKFKNYSNLWLETLANNNSIEYLESLLPFLDQLVPHFPPAKRPPPVGEHFSTATTSEVVDNDYSGVTNMFNDLLINDDSSVESETDAGRQMGMESNTNDDESIKVQVRYLKVRVLCGIAETYRNQAMSALREKDYVNVRVMWQLAWNTLISCQENIDEWWALLCNLNDDPFSTSSQLPKLSKKHDRVQLVELFDALHILIEDTERERENALVQISKKLEFIERKLNPMIRDRNEVKISMGEEKWTNNPEPKQTYAMKRKQWEEDKKLLIAAMEVVQQLNFSAIYDGRG